MARRTECYVDTSGFIAFLDKSDSYHSLYRRLFSEPPPLVTSALVIAEGHGWFLLTLRSTAGGAVPGFHGGAAGRLTIEAFDSDGLVRVSRVVKKYADQKLTLADAHGLAIMQTRKSALCWSTDRHLGLGGAARQIS